MNYVSALSTVHCHSCGDEHPAEAMFELRGELVCATCMADHEAATAKADRVELGLLSRDWFKSPTAAALRKAITMLAWDAFEKWNRAQSPDRQRD